MLMNLPEIGDWIDNEKAIQLCDHYCRCHEGFCKIALRIKNYPADFKPWKFDGASCIPNETFSRLFNIPNLIEIALRHDLKYAYGLVGEDSGRDKLAADWEFGLELLEDGASPGVAIAAVAAVQAFGGGDSDFSYGFARK